MAERAENGWTRTRNVWLGAAAVSLALAPELQSHTPVPVLVGVTSLAMAGAAEVIRKHLFDPLHQQQFDIQPPDQLSD